MKTSVTYLILMFKQMLIFRILASWKATFSHRSISLYEICPKEFWVLGGQ